ncbi:MAG: hypothetical protein ACI9IP_002148 [Arcticibacterium sp.]
MPEIGLLLCHNLCKRTKSRQLRWPNLMKLISWHFFAIAFLFLACVDTYDVSIEGSRKYLIVEGSITNIFDEDQTIRIFETDDQSDFISTDFTKTIFSKNNEAVPVENASVEVIENGSVIYSLNEISPGFYEMPNGFLAQVGNEYQLKFSTTDGKAYASSTELMKPVPDVSNYEIRFNPTGVKKTRLFNIQTATHDFYLDFNDPEDEVNFYSWSWTDYEIQNVCHTCKQGLYFPVDEVAGLPERCEINTSFNVNTSYDYKCQSLCWEIYDGDDITIFSDVFTNGQPQKNKLVAQVPAFQLNSCLVTIQQKSLTPGAFRYLKLIEDQSVNSGSLADTPPAPIKSNVLNVDAKEELVLGYFTASAVKEVRHMLNRSDAPNLLPDRIFSILNNRDVVFELDGQFRPLVPLAPCLSSSTRTSDAPRNWQFGI